MSIRRSMGKNRNLYAVILAGGCGTRFWPVSRRLKPKQFLNITGSKTLLQQTISRILGRVIPANIYVVTGEVYQKEAQRQTAPFKIPRRNILAEPEGKNTSPAVCWAALRIQQIRPDAVMAVLPSDHLIQKKKAFLKVLDQAAGLAGGDHLVTLGIPPTRPETGYGYLKTRPVKGKNILRVEKFIEKPNLVKAKQFLKINRRGGFETRPYFWNSGMFVWKVSAILREFHKYLPRIPQLLAGTTDQSHIKKVWGSMPNISVDYGILEKARNVAAVPADGIGWSDLGSWESLAEILAKDKKGNSVTGNVLTLNCRDSLIQGHRRLVAAIGLENMMIIDTPDAVLVCPKHLSQDVKKLAAILKQKNLGSV